MENESKKEVGSLLKALENGKPTKGLEKSVLANVDSRHSIAKQINVLEGELEGELEDAKKEIRIIEEILDTMEVPKSVCEPQGSYSVGKYLSVSERMRLFIEQYAKVVEGKIEEHEQSPVKIVENTFKQVVDMINTNLGIEYAMKNPALIQYLMDKIYAEKVLQTNN